MINLSIECPISLLEYTKDMTDFHFCIASTALKYPLYKEFYRREAKTRYVMLDNGAYEDHAGGIEMVSCELLAGLADYIHPNLVWAPDKLFDRKYTEELSLAFLNEYKNKPWKIGFIPQGETVDEIVESFMEHHNKFDFIGLSFLNPRVEVMERLGFYIYAKPLHMLGLTTIEEMSHWPLAVLSLDTSKPIKASMQGVPIQLCKRGTLMTPTDTCDNLPLVKANIEIMKMVCQCIRTS